jgi:hypothetical protein
MYWVTLPFWFWIAYYLLILLFFTTAIYCIIKKRMTVYSMIALIFTITVPMISLIFSIGRPIDQTEFEYLALQLKQGSLWSIYSSIGYVYLLVWFIVVLLTSKNQKYRVR